MKPDRTVVNSARHTVRDIVTFHPIARLMLGATMAAVAGSLGARAGGGGYVGPSCAVVDDQLYMHGFYIRRLSADELRDFLQYQSTLDVWRQLSAALSRGAASVAPRDSQLLAAPRVPAFCNGLDDSVEVVLDGCTVRNHKVYVADRFVRELNPTEKLKIDVIIRPDRDQSAGRPSDKRRRRRSISPLESLLNSSDIESEPLRDAEPPLPRFVVGQHNRGSGGRRQTRGPLRLAQLSQRRTEIEPRGSDRRDGESNEAGNPVEKSNDNNLPKENIALFNHNKITTNNNDKMGPSSEIIQQQQQANDCHNTNNNDGSFQSKRRRSPITSDDGYAVPAGTLNLNDPLMINLLQSLAVQQQTVNQIVDAKRSYQQQQLQQQQPANNGIVESLGNTGQVESQVPSSLSGVQPMRVGDKILIGGQTYVAVPLASFATPSAIFGGSAPTNGGVPTLGLLPIEVLRVAFANENAAANQLQQFPADGHVQYGNGRGILPSVNFFQGASHPMPHGENWAYSENEQHHNQFHHYVPSDPSAIQPNIRYHPESIPTQNTRTVFVGSGQRQTRTLPHEICQNLNSDGS